MSFLKMAGAVAVSMVRPIVGLRSFTSLTCRVGRWLPAAPTAPAPPSLLDRCTAACDNGSHVRTAMRMHFPRPRESKRLRAHGWKTRLATPAGRRIIMRRMLKGRHVLSH